MKSILIFQDSVEGTEYDFTRSVRTIKGYGMDPLSVIPALFDADGNDLTTDIQESLEYAFGEHMDAGAFGYTTNSATIDAVAEGYHANSMDFPIVAAPSMLSENGDILVDENVYNSVIDNLIPITKLLVINHMEAELLAGFECVMPTDFSRAVKKIFNDYGCCALVLACRDTSLRNILFDGKHVDAFIDPSDRPLTDYSLTAAIACELAEGKEMNEAVKSAFERCFEKKEEKKASAPVAKAAPATVNKPAPATVETVKTTEPISSAVQEEAAATEPKSGEAESVTAAAGSTVTPVKKSILGAGVLASASGASTRSLVSPAKSLRDIARSIELTTGSSSSENEGRTPSPAVTSSLKKETDNQRTLNELAALSARLKKLKESSAPASAEDLDVNARAD